MKTLTKEVLAAVLALFFLGGLSSTQVMGAQKPRKASQVPASFELYVKQDKKTVRLKQGDLIFKTGLTQGTIESGFYGIPLPPKIRLDIKPFEILIFDPETAGASIRLDKLALIETAPATTFDLQTTKISPSFFEKIYRVKYDASLPINLWCIESNIPLQLTPIVKKPGWYRAVPQQHLEAGVYAINFGCADGPRIYTGDLLFYPFTLSAAPEPQPPVCKPVRRSKRVRAPEPPPAMACPPVPKPRASTPAPPAASSQLDAGFNYMAVGSPVGRREYRITNNNNVPWHNVNISVYTRDSRFPATVLGPVTLYKDIVLPDHTVNQKPDKTMLQYETLNDAGAKLYLKIKCKEGIIKKAWKNVYMGDSGPAELMEIPWDLEE